MQCIFTEKKRIDELKVSSGHSNLFHEHISAEDGGPGVLCTDTKFKINTNLYLNLKYYNVLNSSLVDYVCYEHLPNIRHMPYIQIAKEKQLYRLSP